MKKLINTILLVAMIFGFSVTGISALSYNYGGTVSFVYTGVSQTVTKTSSTSQKALVNANKVGFNYWFRTVDYATGVETGCKYVNQYGSNLSLVNSNTVNGRRYYAQAHREYPTESGYVSGTWQP